MRKRNRDHREYFIVALFAVALTNFSVFGQIRVPKIVRSGQNPTAQTPAAGQNAPALQTSGGSYIDDGFTWFEAVNTKDPEIKQTNVYTGWALKSSLRLMGEYPRHSAFKIVVSKAGVPVVSNRCEANNYNIPKNPADVSFVYIDSCWTGTAATKEVGKFDVDIIFINADINAETSLRKYKIDVLKIDRVNGQTGKFSTPDASRYVISRHAEAPVSILYLRPAKAYGYVLSGEAQRTFDMNQVEIMFSLSPSEIGKNIPQSYTRCSVDGKDLQFPGPQPYADLAATFTERRVEEVYTDRIAAQYKAGTEYRDDIGFRLQRVVLPLSFGNYRTSNRLKMQDFPGKWECSLMNNGDIYRTWRWTVGRDGMPARHPEQNGNVNLYMNSYLIDMEIPAGGTALDKRLVPTSATEGLFYGQKWTTPEGKAIAAKMPTKGSPIPVPSNKIK
ncbi:hypothetical protein BH10ACI3_BH10ACI3_18510 [soil metagenome]